MNTPHFPPFPPSDDPLEAQLRKTAAPLADDGFSTRVLSSLPRPAPKPRRLPNRRTVACSLGALTGLLWTLAQSESPGATNLPAIGSTWMTSVTSLGNFLADPILVAVGIVILASLAFAFFHEIAAKLD